MPDIDPKLQFDIARRTYPGVKRGLDTEWSVFIKNKDWKEVLPLLMPAIRKQISWREWLKNKNRFIPQWKNFQTWLNQRCWEFEMPEYDSTIAIKRAQRPAIVKTQAGPTKSVGEILEARKREYDAAMARERERVMKEKI